jgi:hypothetical protein
MIVLPFWGLLSPSMTRANAESEVEMCRHGFLCEKHARQSSPTFVYGHVDRSCLRCGCCPRTSSFRRCRRTEARSSPSDCFRESRYRQGPSCSIDQQPFLYSCKSLRTCSPTHTLRTAPLGLSGSRQTTNTYTGLWSRRSRCCCCYRAAGSSPWRRPHPSPYARRRRDQYQR